jgi:hypothetical protein
MCAAHVLKLKIRINNRAGVHALWVAAKKLGWHSRQMTVKGWIWRSLIAGLSGTIVHALFMYFKAQTGLLPSFL